MLTTRHGFIITGPGVRVAHCLTLARSADLSGTSIIEPEMTSSTSVSETRTVAKAFIKLGLKRHHSVGILGFNSPEWFLADLGAVFAGGIATGIYPTNSTEACKFIAENCRANILVVEDEKQLEKIISVRDQLPGEGQRILLGGCVAQSVKCSELRSLEEVQLK